jgi:hypothetical protein
MWQKTNGWENYLNDITNYATKRVLSKTTSNDQTSAHRLAGAYAMIGYHIADFRAAC